MTVGPHGLPLFGRGDWNDGMNRAGQAGRGESTWLGFFLHVVLSEFAVLCEERNEGKRARRYAAGARRLASQLELAWDGEWYRRGYYDDAVRSMLVSRSAQIMPLLDPSFDQSAQDPGYIKAYPPGIRENGGQYTHAAVWTVMALARLGSGDEAVELFHMLNPINHARTAADAFRYKTEPYVMAGDVYARTPVGVGGAGTRDRPHGCIEPVSRARSALAAVAPHSR